MRWLQYLISLIFICGGVYLVWWDVQHTEVSMLSAFLAAQIPSALCILFLAYRSRYLSNNSVPLLVAFYGNSLSVAGTLILPARLSELGKPFYFKALSGFSIPSGVALVVEERIWDVVSLTVLAGITIFLIGESNNSVALEQATRIIAVLALAGIALLILLPKFVKALPVLSKLEEKYGLFSHWSPRRMTVSFAISAMIWGLSVLTLVAAYSWSGLPPLSLVQFFFLFVAATLGLVITITPGGLGTYEAAIVTVLVNCGVDWNAALAFAIGFRVCWMAIPITVAIYSVWLDRGKLKDIISFKDTNDSK